VKKELSDIMSTMASIKTEDDISTMVQVLMEVKHEPTEKDISANIEENCIHGHTTLDIALPVKVRCQIYQHYMSP